MTTEEKIKKIIAEKKVLLETAYERNNLQLINKTKAQIYILENILFGDDNEWNN